MSSSHTTAVFSALALKYIYTQNKSNVEIIPKPDPYSKTLTYVSTVIGLLLVFALLGLIVFASMMKKQRSLHGTYSPQKQEFNAPRIEMTEMFKVPPNERLI